MPLNNTQKEIIDSIIQFYFDDFSTEEKKLDSQIKLLHSAFENSIDEKDEKHELYQLQKCIFFPEINLRRLEESNPDITFKDVQEYILDYATSKVKAAAEAAHLELEWPKDLFHAVFTSMEKFNKPFKSIPLQQESKESPWEIQRFEGRNFEIIAILNGAAIPDFQLRVTINASTIIERTIAAPPPPNIPILTPADEMRVREAIKRLVANLGEDLACLLTMDELVRLNIIDDISLEYADNEFKSIGHIQYLLTHRYYLDLLLQEKEEGFTQIWDINTRETSALINPGVINALESKIFDIEKARKLLKPQIALLSHFFYSKLISNKELPYDLPEEICKNLICPATVNLITQQKIKLSDAIEMSSSACALISNEFYFELIMKNKIDFKSIKKLNSGQEYLLLTPLIIQQIGQGIIKIDDILNLTPQHLRLIGENPLITELINEKILTLNDLKRINFKPANRFLQKLNFNSGEERETLIYHLKNTEKKQKIKKLIKDFFILMEQNILNSEDLRYFLKFLESSLLACFGRDRFDPHRNHLLLSPTIKDRCENNLQARLQFIIEEKPQILLNQSKDSIQLIKAACELTDVKFQTVGERTLLYSIDASYKGFHRIPVNKLIKESRAWDDNIEKAWAHAFSIRIMRFLEGKKSLIDNKCDSEESISSDLKNIPIKENLSLATFHNYLLENLHHQLKIQITEVHDLDADTTPKFYKHLFQKMSQAEDDMCDLTNKTEIQKKLIQSFNDIASLAKLEVEKKTTPIVLPPRALEEKKGELLADSPMRQPLSASPLRRVPSFSFFNAHGDSEKPNMSTFCGYLSSLPKILGVTEVRAALECKS